MAATAGVRTDGMVQCYGFMVGYNFPNHTTITDYLANHPDTKTIYDIDRGIIHRVANTFDSCKAVLDAAIIPGVRHAILRMPHTEVILEPTSDPETYDRVAAAISGPLKQCAKDFVLGKIKELPLVDPKKVAAEDKAISYWFSANWLDDIFKREKWYLTPDAQTDAVRWAALSQLYKVDAEAKTSK